MSIYKVTVHAPSSYAYLSSYVYLTLMGWQEAAILSLLERNINWMYPRAWAEAREMIGA